MAKKSLFLTYVLWLFGGFFGLHHFYLNRDYQALLWWMTLGGYFGAGWLRDLWRIPEYVKDVNEDPLYMSQLAEKISKHEKPPTNYFRYFIQMTTADSLGLLITSAIPKEIIGEPLYRPLTAVVVPLAPALGAYLVGNIGRHEGKLTPTLIGAYITAPLYLFMDVPIFLSSICSVYVFNSYCKQWRRTPTPRKPLLQRLVFFFVCGSVYVLLWSSWMYFTCTVVHENAEPVKCRDAAKHFFKSPIWKEFVNVMKEIWRSIQVHGWREVWKEIVSAFDPTGEVNALKVLGLEQSATQQEITLRYRKLSREWHPDKHKNPESKRIAQEKFIEIQQAYEILSKIKSQRVSQNIRNPDVQNTEEHQEL